MHAGRRDEPVSGEGELSQGSDNHLGLDRFSPVSSGMPTVIR
jgi:hypothetical protein